MAKVIGDNPSSSSTRSEDFPPIGAESLPKVSSMETDVSSSKGNPNPSWSSLFSSTAVKLQYVAPVVKEGKKSVAISKSLFDQGSSMWGDCLLGQFFGPPPRSAVIRSMADKLWGRNGRVDVIPLDGEDFLFKFMDPDTMEWVLEGGLWFIANRPLLLEKWKPGLIVEKLSLKKFPIWIVLRGLSIELLTPEGLSCVVSAIGTPLSLDKATEQRRRVHFARVCVEVSWGDELPEQILVDIEEIGQLHVAVEYAWKPSMCTNCKALGHLVHTCKATKEWIPKASSVPPEMQKSDAQKSDDLRKTANVVPQGENSSQGGSRSSAAVNPKGAESNRKGKSPEVGSNDVATEEPANSDAASSSNVHNNVPGDVLPDGAKGTPTAVPNDVLPDGAKGAKGTPYSSTPCSSFINSPTVAAEAVYASSLRQSSKSYSVPKKPVSSSKAKATNSKIQIYNSFSILNSEIEPSKNKFAPQKRTRKQTKKAMESLAQSTKGVWEELDSQ